MSRPGAAVIADPVDVDRVGRRIGRDLEVDRVARLDAVRRREALDRRIAGAADVPLRRRGTGKTVLRDDSIRGRRARIGGRRLLLEDR